MQENPWPLRDTTIKVFDLPRQIAFYELFGFQLISTATAAATLAAGDGVRLTLQTVPDLQLRPPLSAGLFHFAIVVPDRPTLGSFVRHASQQQWNFVGAADHLVSEALYFADPEDNGIEVYCDRPRDSWQWSSGRVNMATLPLDLKGLAMLGDSPWAGFPASTRLGHVHLTVTNLDASQQFYESLGLVLTANWGPFRFLSYDGYHHHLAINLAAGHNAAPVAPTFAGLASFSLRRHSVRSTLTDPSRILVTPYVSVA